MGSGLSRTDLQGVERRMDASSQYRDARVRAILARVVKRLRGGSAYERQRLDSQTKKWCTWVRVRFTDTACCEPVKDKTRNIISQL